MTDSLAIGWIYPGEVNGLFMQSVTGYLQEDLNRGAQSRMAKGRGGTIGILSGPRIATARNNLVNSFLDQTSTDWLLMVDTDIVFSPHDVDVLFESADRSSAPIVGGLYFGGGLGGPVFPQMFVFVQPEENDGNPVKTIYDYPEGKCEVDATGAGFLLMHRGALQRIGKEFRSAYPWFAEGTALHDFVFGEDVAFCLRAKKLGIPIYVDTRAKLGHVKPHVIDEDLYRANRARVEEIGLDGLAEEMERKLRLEKV